MRARKNLEAIRLVGSCPVHLGYPARKFLSESAFAFTANRLGLSTYAPSTHCINVIKNTIRLEPLKVGFCNVGRFGKNARHRIFSDLRNLVLIHLEPVKLYSYLCDYTDVHHLLPGFSLSTICFLHVKWRLRYFGKYHGGLPNDRPSETPDANVFMSVLFCEHSSPKST